MIYYFDDAMDGVRDRFNTSYLETGEFNDILRHFDTVPSDLDSLFSNDDKVVIFYHDSMPDARSIENWIDGQPSVSFIQFSDGVDFCRDYNAADDEYADSWTMKKKLFYEHLGGFLRAYRNGERSLEHFLEYELPEVNEETADSEEVRFVFDTESPDIGHPSETEEFVRSNIYGKTTVVFDLDALSPEFVSYMAKYIRLSIHSIGSGALASFVFVGEQTFDHYLVEYRKTQSHEALLWVGSTFIEKNGRPLDEVITSDFVIDRLTPQEYINDFLKCLKVAPNAEVGNHSIANYWGAYVIARHIAGFETQAQEIYLQALEQDALYLKYLIVDRIRSMSDIINILNGSGDSVEFDVEPLQMNRRPKVLLVDDQDDIWTNVIEALLPEADLTVIGKSNDLINSDNESGFLTPEANRILDTREFDLILLDLRLGGVLEESIVNGEDCSGMRILRRITDKNPGQQVIMFTSSNKAWNLKKALTMAAGYYIKESPLQPFNEDETLQNLEDFLTTIESCLEYKDLKNIVKNIQTSENVEFRDEYRDPEEKSKEVRRQLGIVKTMALSQSREVGTRGRNWTYVYIALFQVLEIAKRLSPDFQPTNPGNRNNDQNRSLVNLVVNLLPAMDRQAYRTLLHVHNSLRAELVHRETPRHATYDEFKDLWSVVYDILVRLSYPLEEGI